VKQFGLAGILLCWLIAGCGKVGDPHPPAIRIPAKVDDLAASQNMDRVTLIWTNPSRNVDGTKVDDLTKVTIWEGDKDIKTVPASLPGKQQMEPLDVRDQLNTTEFILLQSPHDATRNQDHRMPHRLRLSIFPARYRA